MAKYFSNNLFWLHSGQYKCLCVRYEKQIKRERKDIKSHPCHIDDHLWLLLYQWAKVAKTNFNSRHGLDYEIMIVTKQMQLLYSYILNANYMGQTINAGA